MTANRTLPALLLLATGAIATPAAAQLRGTVGQQMPQGYEQNPQAAGQAGVGGAAGGRGGASSLSLPTLDDEIRAAEARRKARAQQRLVTSAGNPTLDPKTRGTVQRATRANLALTRPPNKAVPLRTTPAPLPPGGDSQAFPQLIAPGLTEPVAAKKVKPKQDDPYAPLGINLGGMILRPAIDISAGYDTNPLRSSTASKGSKVYQVAPEISLQSDWSRHALQFDLRGTYDHYPDVDNASRPKGDAKLTFRGDMGNDGRLDLELRGRIDTQRPGSPDLTSAVQGRPLTYQSGASAGYTQNFGPAAVTATGLIDRYDFQDAKTTAGATISQQDRAYTQYGVKLRGAYEITPGITPYVEVGADRRVYDLKLDSGGYERSSHGLTAKAGSTFELTRTLTGDISAGYGMRDYTDGRLPNIAGALVDANLVWQASPLTKATLKVGSEFLETTLAGSSGAINRRIGLLIQHDLLRNLTLSGALDYSHADYNGISRKEQSIIAGLKLDYKIDRTFVFRTSYSFEKAISSLPGNSSQAHIIMAGLRIQR